MRNWKTNNKQHNTTPRPAWVESANGATQVRGCLGRRTRCLGKLMLSGPGKLWHKRYLTFEGLARIVSNYLSALPQPTRMICRTETNFFCALSRSPRQLSEGGILSSRTKHEVSNWPGVIQLVSQSARGLDKDQSPLSMILSPNPVSRDAWRCCFVFLNVCFISIRIPRQFCGFYADINSISCRVIFW